MTTRAYIPKKMFSRSICSLMIHSSMGSLMLPRSVSSLTAQICLKRSDGLHLVDLSMTRRVVPSWSRSLIHSRARDTVYLPCQVVGSVLVTGSVRMAATTWARSSCLPSGVESECHSPTVRRSVENEQVLQIIGSVQRCWKDGLAIPLKGIVGLGRTLGHQQGTG